MRTFDEEGSSTAFDVKNGRADVFKRNDTWTDKLTSVKWFIVTEGRMPIRELVMLRKEAVDYGFQKTNFQKEEPTANANS